jgi:hypothetical protein
MCIQTHLRLELGGVHLLRLHFVHRFCCTATAVSLPTANPKLSKITPLPRCRDANDPKFLILGMRCQADLPAASFTSR